MLGRLTLPSVTMVTAGELIFSSPELKVLKTKGLTPFLQHPLLCRPVVTTVRYCQEQDDTQGSKRQFAEKKEGEKGYMVLDVDWQTSVEYMNSEAYKETYGDEPVWVPYRRSFKGHYRPATRMKCVRSGKIATGSPCPVCRDDYLVLHHKNLKLLKQFVMEETGEPLPSIRTGLCREQQRKLELELARAVDFGYVEVPLPFRSYDYEEYRKLLEDKKEQEAS